MITGGRFLLSIAVLETPCHSSHAHESHGEGTRRSVSIQAAAAASVSVTLQRGLALCG